METIYTPSMLRQLRTRDCLETEYDLLTDAICTIECSEMLREKEFRAVECLVHRRKRAIEAELENLISEPNE